MDQIEHRPLIDNFILKSLPLFFLLGLLFWNVSSYSQSKKIVIERSDYVDINETEVPGAVLLSGNVTIVHEGARMTCNKAYHFAKDNFIKAFGNVHLTQGDTVVMTSAYAEYNGDKKLAFAKGNVTVRDPQTTLVTDSIRFDRKKQEVYYESDGVIYEKENTLKSKVGRYYLKQKKYEFLTAVTLTNPKYVIKTNHLNYHTKSGDSYLLGPSTIKGKDNFIYTEKGIYNTKTNQAKLVKKSYIKYQNQLIQGDSLYYDRNKEFSSASKNIKVTDSINRSVLKGDYGEVYRKKDSIYITKKAVIINKTETDSVYLHAKQFIVTGKPSQRIIRGFNNVRIFSTDISGKCDSIHSKEQIGLTKMIGNPVLWNKDSQLTGDVIHLVAEKNSKQLDSLKIINNAFMIQKDSLSNNAYNQVKGVYLYGKIINKRLNRVEVVKNAEVIFYVRDDKQELIGINKSLSNRIITELLNNKVNTINFYQQVDGNIYPEKDLPENARKLRGFLWREEERIKSLSELFITEKK